MRSDAIQPYENPTPNLDAPPPELWNPGPAASWSLLFTPMFGACLHAINWSRLGRMDKARANFIWMGVYFVFLAVVMVSIFLPDTRSMEAVFRVAGLGLLLGWYFSLGKSQVEYVTTTFPDGYPKRGWLGPIAIGIVCTIGFLGAVFGLAIIAEANPETRAATLSVELKPMILEEWRKTPTSETPVIQALNLKPAGPNKYQGTITATFNGQLQNFTIELREEAGMVHWDIQPVR